MTVKENSQESGNEEDKRWPIKGGKRGIEEREQKFTANFQKSSCQ